MREKNFRPCPQARPVDGIQYIFDRTVVSTLGHAPPQLASPHSRLLDVDQREPGFSW
jgi:hypothetical protein